MLTRILPLQWRAITVRAALAGFVALPMLAPGPGADAKTPGTTYCYMGICHRVLTIAETAEEIGKPHHVIASYYDAPWRDRFNPRMETSSGEIFRPEDQDNVASPHYPDGTRLLVWSPLNGAAAVVRVNNAGPYYSNRTLDASQGLAVALGFGFRGVSRVELVVLSAPRPSETEYALARRYEPVAGLIGTFPSLAAAHAVWLKMPEAAAAAKETSMAVAEAAALPQRPAGQQRIVTIPGGGARIAGIEGPDALGPYAPATAGSGRVAGTSRLAARARGRYARVVLKPVKLRRPLMLAALAAKRAAVASRRAPRAKVAKAR